MEASKFIADMQAAVRDTLALEQGSIKNLAYCDKGRAKNWVAVVTKDFTKPGGLERSFFARGPRDRVFVPGDLQPGAWIEFGGDKLSSGGKRKHKRLYREVVSFDGDTLVLKPVSYDEIGRLQHVDVEPPESEASFAGAADDSAAALRRFSDGAILDEARRRGLI